MEKPTKCLVEPPSHTYQVDIGGEFINVKKLSRITGVDYVWLTKVFSGQSGLPGVLRCQKIARELGMTTDGFVEALLDRTHRLTRRKSERRRHVWRTREQERQSA